MVVLALCWASPAFAWSVSSLLGLWRLCSKRHQLSFLQRCSASVAQRFFMGCARLQVRAPFWPSVLTLRSSGLAFSQPLILAVSPFIFRFYAGQHLFQRLAFLRAFSFGFLALCWASPACTAQVSCLFGLQRLHSKRHQLSFLQRCAASVAQRFFMGRVRLQGWAPPFGLRV